MINGEAQVVSRAVVADPFGASSASETFGSPTTRNLTGREGAKPHSSGGWFTSGLDIRLFPMPLLAQVSPAFMHHSPLTLPKLEPAYAH
jgi:hypothetical protein